MRISLSEQSFRFIEVHKSRYEFEKNNSGPVRCRDCKGTIGEGLGIFRHSYKRNGFLCFACFSKDVTIINTDYDGTDRGFFVDSIGRLRACYLSSGSFLTVEVIEAVYRSLLDIASSSIELLLGEEGAHPFKIMDTAESVVRADP